MTMTDDKSVERAAVEQLVEAGLLDELMSRVDAGDVQLTGEGGFLPEMIKAVLERGLQAELTGHLGYEKGDPAGRGSGTRATASRPRRWRPRSATSGWARPGTRRGPSSPAWCHLFEHGVGDLRDRLVGQLGAGRPGQIVDGLRSLISVQ